MLFKDSDNYDRQALLEELGVEDGSPIRRRQPTTVPGLEPSAPAPAPEAPKGPDTSAWNTDGYAKPESTAQNFGNVLAGFDQTKWADANHQTPKYVTGRILQEASGGDGRLQSQEERDAAIAAIQKAYPGTTFNGKDKVNIPGVGEVDIFTGASRGEYGAAFQTGGGAPKSGLASAMDMSMGGGALDMTNALIPTDDGFYAQAQQYIQSLLQPGNRLDRDALLGLMGNNR
jgi:hypothetical protein